MSLDNDNRTSLNLLRSYYPVVETLHSYLGNILERPSSANILIHETDTLIYRTLLKQAYVANAKGVPDTRLVLSKPMVPLKEVSQYSPTVFT